MEDAKVIKQKINTYWIIGLLSAIVIFLVAYIIVGRTICAKIIADYVSAFSTLLSILLSVFAIFFTFYATQDTNRHIDNLSDKLWSQTLSNKNGIKNEDSPQIENFPENKVN